MNHEQQIEDGARAIAPDDWKLADAPSFAHLPSAAREGLISKSSKQARAAWAAFHPTVSTVEELDALPVGSVVISEGYRYSMTYPNYLVAFQKLYDGHWHRGGRVSDTHSDVIFPAVVLHYGATE